MVLPLSATEAPSAIDIEGAPVVARHPLPEIRQLSVGASITRGALALLSTQPLTWSASLLWTIAAPRLLGAEALGQVTIASTIAVLAATVAGLGISEYLVRRVAQRPHTLRHDAGVALAVQMTTAVLGALLLALVGLLIPTSIVEYPLLLVALLQTLAAPGQTVLLSSFRGSERHKNYAWFTAAVAVVCPIGATLVLLAGGDAVTSTAAFGLLVITTTLLAWKLSGLGPSFPAVNRSLLPEFGEFVRGGLPFLSWQITLAIYGGIDRLLLGAFVPAAEVGWYAAAYRVIGMTVFVPTLVVSPLFPVLSRSTQDGETLRRTITQTSRVLLVIMVALAGESIVVAPVVPRILGWPADFENAVPLMSILALHLPIVAIDMVLGVVLMAIHRESRLVGVGIAAAVFNVAANLVCIPLVQEATGNGAIGASIVTVATEVFMCVGAIIFIPKGLLDPAIAWEAGRLVLAGVASVVVGLMLLPTVLREVPELPFAVAVSVLGSGVTYIVVAMLVRALKVEDVRSLWSVLLSRPMGLPRSGGELR